LSAARAFPGELEWMVLLAVLRLGDEANALAVLEELEVRADRTVSRGTLYKTLGRMSDKGWLDWEVDRTDVPERGGLPRRRFRVTREGLAAAQAADEAFLSLRQGLGNLLGDT